MAHTNDTILRADAMDLWEKFPITLPKGTAYSIAAETRAEITGDLMQMLGDSSSVSGRVAAY